MVVATSVVETPVLSFIVEVEDVEQLVLVAFTEVDKLLELDKVDELEEADEV